ncbi:MAG: DHA2 family efflux MFS transporter permease subunit [Coriobacteriales bacterium]|jgi:EmrB/QacA subfamily drug resistance transporter
MAYAVSMKKAGRGAVALFTILVLGSSLGNLSQTALNAMLPTVLVDFGVGVDIGQWLATIYMLSLGIAVPLTSFLTKRIPERSYALMSLGIFFAGAVLDAVAPVFWMLVLGRIFQAVAAGFMMPVMQNIVIAHFPRERHGTMMGIAGIAMGFAPNIGPTIGSLFTVGLGWRYFFVMLLVLPVILVVFTVLFVRPSSEGSAPVPVKLDVRSFILSAIGFGGVLAGLTETSSRGLAHPFVWISLVAGVVVLVVFLRRQRRVDNPLINLGIFKSDNYRTAFWMQNLLFGSFMGVTLLIPLYIQGPLGGTAVDAGIVLLPGAVVALVVNPLAGIIGDKLGKERVIRVSAIIFLAGALLALLFDENTPLWVIAACQAVRGIGISASMGCTITWMLGGLPRPLVGDGSSFSILVRQACSSLGTAVMVFIFTAISAVVPGMLGYQVAFGFSALLAVIMLVMAYSKVKAPRGESPQGGVPQGSPHIEQEDRR